MAAQHRRYLPPTSWALHPFYGAHVLLFAAHLNRGIETDPDIADSHFLYGRHPLYAVEIAGIITSVQQRDYVWQIVVDDGTGAAQATVFMRDRDGAGAGAEPEPGQAVVLRGSVKWGPRLLTIGEQTREVKVNSWRVLPNVSELTRWNARALRMHVEVYSRPLSHVMPASTPMFAAIIEWEKVEAEAGQLSPFGAAAPWLSTGGALESVNNTKVGAAASREDRLFSQLVSLVEVLLNAHHPHSDWHDASTHARRTALQRAAAVPRQADGADDTEDSGSESENKDGDADYAAADIMADETVMAAQTSGAAAAEPVRIGAQDVVPRTGSLVLSDERLAVRAAEPGSMDDSQPEAGDKAAATELDDDIERALEEGRWIWSRSEERNRTLGGPPAASSSAPALHALPVIFTAAHLMSGLVSEAPELMARLRALPPQRAGAHRGGSGPAVAHAGPPQQQLLSMVSDACMALVRDGHLYRYTAAATIVATASASGTAACAPDSTASFGLLSYRHVVLPAARQLVQQARSEHSQKVAAWQRSVDTSDTATAAAEAQMPAEPVLPERELVSQLRNSCRQLKLAPDAVVLRMLKQLVDDGELLRLQPGVYTILL